MIERRWRAVEADIQRWYGVDARTCGARRLLSLIEGLPSGVRTFGGGGWLIEHELAAAHLEVTVAANSRRRKGRPRFVVPRPQPEQVAPKPSMRSRLAAIAQQLRGG